MDSSSDVEVADKAACKVVSPLTRTTIISSITLRAFKSFDRKITVSPLTPFVCIVGPNGTGKSVIGEALAFAIGASSRAIRATSFSSLVSRNSTSNSAKVSVVLERGEKGEKAKFSRVLSGSSTRFFWKDIDHNSKREISLSELRQKLADFKVSASHIERFIVMQNRVCARIKQPKDLVKYLELVFGTGHFEEEIEAADQEIDRRCAELECIQQALWDTAMKRKELYPEVEKWKRFTEKWQRFSEKRYLTLFLKRQKESLQARLNDLKNEKKEKTNTLLKVQKNWETLKQSAAKLIQEHSELCRTLKECSKKTKMAKKEHESLRIQMVKEEVQLKELEEEVSKLKESCENEQSSFAERQEEAEKVLNILANEVNELEEKKKALSKEKEAEEHKQAFMLSTQKANSKVEDLIVEEAFLTSKLNRLQERHSLLHEKRRNQMLQASELEVEIKTLKSALEERLRSEKDWKIKLSEAETRFAELQSEIDQINKHTLTRMRAEIYISDVELNRLQKKLSEIQNRGEKLSKEDDAANALIRTLKGKLHGRITDLFTVINEMEKPVAAILCHLTNPATTFIVEDRDTANVIISYFSEKRIGIATCEILSELRTRFKNANTSETGPYVRPALQNLEFEERFRSVFLKYFDKWCIARDLCAATSHFQRKQGYSEAYHIVTENGDIFKKDGEVVAANWSTKVKLALVSRSDSIKKDESNSLLIINEVHERKMKYRNEVESHLTEGMQKLEQLKSQKMELYEQIQKLKQSFNSLSDSGKEAVLRKLEDRETKLGLIMKLINDKEDLHLTKEIKTLNGKLETVRRQIGGLEGTLPYESDLLGITRKIKDLDDTMRLYARRLQEKLSASKSLRNRLEVLKSGGKYMASLSEKSTELVLLRESFLQTKKQLQTMEHKLKSENELEVLLSKKRKLETHISDCSHEETVVKSNEVSARKALNSLETCELATEDQLRKVLIILHDNSGSQLQKKVCLSGKSSTVYANIDQDNEGVSLAQEELSLIEAKRSIQADALEEDVMYRKKEFHFKTELDRINEQIESQRKHKENLENERYSIFVTTVKKLNEELSSIYQKLSKHGDANLSFTEEKRLLFTNGVNLQARPDRYKWRAFNSLSGGQQALASLSLSFSLQKLFPSPFYFLDEIDSSLDTRNARLIAEYIKNQSSAQYIVVSHRPQLYEVASSLVGVYHYRGASTCITVKCQTRDVN